MPKECDYVGILTKSDALRVAQKLMKDHNVDVQDYSLSSYSEHKLGHMGLHLRLTITIKKSDTNKAVEIRQFFVKALLQSSQAAVDFVKEYAVFTGELDFFEKVKPLLMENYKDKAWSPTCYLAKKQFLVLEDLRMEGFKLATNLLDETTLIKSTLEALARFHACSIVAEARLSRLHKEATFLNRHFPNSMKEKYFTESKDPNAILGNSLDLVVAIAESMGCDSRKIRKVFDKLWDAVQPSKRYRNVICHGDLWANNLMFNNAEPQPQCVLVNFQMLRYAPNVLDILQLFYLNTTSNYRKRYERQLIEFYSMVLEQTVRNNDETKTATAPTSEEILEAYQQFRFFGVSLASFYLPFILIDQEKMKEIYDEPDGFSNALLLDRTDMTLAYMKQNESYKNRIEEVVYELADIADY